MKPIFYSFGVPWQTDCQIQILPDEPPQNMARMPIVGGVKMLLEFPCGINGAN